MVDQIVTEKKKGGERNRDVLHAILLVINFEFFNSNCRLLDKTTSNGDDDGNEDNEKQKVHYTDGP